MTKCIYLSYETSRSCASCTGYFCIAAYPKKKLSDISMCVDDEAWDVCGRYTERRKLEDARGASPPISRGIGVLGAPQRTPTPAPLPPPQVPTCEYLGPSQEKCCSGSWCYAKYEPLRSIKVCNSPPSYRECVGRTTAHKRKVKPYTNT